MSAAATRIDVNELVDNREIRAAVEDAVARGEHSYSGLAAAMGWRRENCAEWGDSSRLRRRLGISLLNGRRQSRMHYSTAVLIVRALGRDPVDFGI